MKNLRYYCIQVVVLITFILCSCVNNPTEDTTTTEDKTAPVGGDWQMSIPPFSGLLADTFNIVMNIDNDSTFHLELNERSQKILFSSDGEWSATDDSLFLVGSECKLLDTLPDPDTLKAFDESVCGRTISLPRPQSETDWKIKTESLAYMLQAFPMDSTTASQIPLILPALTFKKTDS